MRFRINGLTVGLSILLLIATLLSVRYWLADRPAAPIEFSGPTMGSTYTVKVTRAPAGVTPETLQAGVIRILADINRQMSTYDPESELSHFNRNPSTDWIAASPELLAVVNTALQVSRLTEGAFDVTIGPVVNLWGFGPDFSAERIPAESSLRAVLQRVGYQRLHTQDTPPALRKERADIAVDLAGVVPGYAADRLADYLESVGVQHYLVDLSGELRLKGRNFQNQPWRVAIEQPSPDQWVTGPTIELSDNGLSTSGDYRNFFEQGGQRYSHLMDPKTGWPVRYEPLSVTVIHESAAFADAMATGLLVLGPERGFELAETQRLAALFIVATAAGFRQKTTRAFARYLAE